MLKNRLRFPISNKKWSEIRIGQHGPLFCYQKEPRKSRKKCDPAWQRRNNSDNISGILNCHSDGKSCYCHQKQVKPKVFRPKLQTLYKKSECLESQQSLDCAEQSSDHRCRKSADNSRTSNRIATKKAPKSCPCYYHSEAEELYRKYFNLTKEKHDDLSKKTFTVVEKSKPDLDFLSLSDKTTAEVLYKQKSSRFLSASASSVALNELASAPSSDNDDTLTNIKQFRQLNYSETHGKSSDLELKPHKCVYRFSLDDRLCPQGENPDQYGLNCCLICHKPMPTWNKNRAGNGANKITNIQGKTTNFEDKNTNFQGKNLNNQGFPYENLNFQGKNLDFYDENPQPGPLEMLEKIYPHTLTPKEINLGTNANIEMCLTERDVRLFNDCFKQKTQRPVYRNSLALRQQKMLGSVLPVGLN